MNSFARRLLTGLVLVLALIAYLIEESRWDVADLAAAGRHERLVVVVAENTRATVWAFAKLQGEWREVLRVKGFVGRGGVTKNKREGDGATPSGEYPLFRAFGTAADPGSRLAYAALADGDFWVDDPESRHYNTRVRGDAPDRDWHSAEELPAQTVAYKYAIVVEYNTDPVGKGLGSAIFLHCSTGAPTAGCVSVSEADMVKLLRFLQPGDAIVIAASVADLKESF